MTKREKIMLSILVLFLCAFMIVGGFIIMEQEEIIKVACPYCPSAQSPQVHGPFTYYYQGQELEYYRILYDYPPD